jgi:tetratricopeptide (TPR) repeat protein
MNAASKSHLPSVALALVLALGTTAFTAPAQAAASAAAGATAAPVKPTVSKPLQKPLQGVQNAMNDKKWDEALAKLKEIEANPAKTPYDTFVMHQFLAYTLRMLGQAAASIPSFEAQIESGFLAPEESERLTKGVAQLYYQEKDYAKASQAGRKFLAGGKIDDDIYTLVAQAEYLQKNYAEVIKLLQSFITTLESRGQVPKEPSLALYSDSFLRLKDNAGAIRALELQVKYYPKRENWANLLSMVRGETSADIVLFNLYRLMGDTETLTAANDINETAQLAIKFGLPGEALSVIQRGMAANAFSTTSEKAAAERQLQTGKTLADADRAGLAKFEAEAKAAKTGEGDVRLGQALLSYDQYDKALEAIQRGIAKGSLRNADEAQILLGITLLRLNRKPDAVAAFNGTKGTDAKLSSVAHLWALHAGS